MARAYDLICARLGIEDPVSEYSADGDAMGALNAVVEMRDLEGEGSGLASITALSARALARRRINRNPESLGMNVEIPIPESFTGTQEDFVDLVRRVYEDDLGLEYTGQDGNSVSFALPDGRGLYFTASTAVSPRGEVFLLTTDTTDKPMHLQEKL